MTGLLFPDSRAAPYAGFDFEIVAARAGARRALLDRIREQVLRIAAESRGWTDAASHEHFRLHFNIEPLYETNALALVRQGETLVGLAGAVNDWRFDSCSLVHLCSVGFLPRAQGRGIMAALMGLLWETTMQSEQIREDVSRGRGYVTAVTQSPYLMGYLDGLFDVHPRPHRTPSDQVVRLARAVAERFDPHLAMEEDTLVLRNEATFFYRRTPYGRNRAMNEFCDRHLRYDAGDVFVVVARIVAERLRAYCAKVRDTHGALFAALGIDGMTVADVASAG